MKFEFNSVEEVLTFASHVNVNAPGSGEVRPGSIDPAAFVEHLGRIASGNGKIAAIKLYRAVFGTGLRESKEAVEAVPVFAPVRGRAALCPDHGCGDPECGCGPERFDVDDTPF
jgi:ribosomal protein L7/L12